MERVQRYDLKSGAVTGRRRTSTGGLVADARVTRTGVLSYKLPGGATRKEYRPPEEVFAPASLATLANATLTDDHPGKVTPQNWRRNTIGHIGGAAKQDGKFVAAELHVQHDDAIGKAEDGELSECSCGYDCDFDPTPGKSPEGEAYDGVQRNIRYNHVALGPPGWGRAGSQVRMRLDAADAVLGIDAATAISGLEDGREDRGPYVRGMTEEERKALADAQKAAKDAETALATARADAKAFTDRLDALETTNKTLKAENDLHKSRESQFNADAKKQADAAAAQATAAKFDSAVEEQVALRADGVRFLGAKWSPKGKTPETIRREVIARLDPEYVAADKKRFDSLSGDALLHVYAMSIEHADKHDGAWDDLQGVIEGARTDAKPGKGEGEEPEEGACDAMAEQKKMHDRKKDGAARRRDRERKAADARGGR